MINPTEKEFIEIKEGDTACFEIIIDEKIVRAFAVLSGDFNPLHLDSQYAGASEFGQIIAHGQLGGALFSRLVGMYLPGKFSLYLKQTFEFKKPIFLNTTVVVEGTIMRKIEAFQCVEIRMQICDKVSKEIYTHGYALVKVTR
jgi:acyl dehydratase